MEEIRKFIRTKPQAVEKIRSIEDGKFKFVIRKLRLDEFREFNCNWDYAIGYVNDLNYEKLDFDSIIYFNKRGRTYNADKNYEMYFDEESKSLVIVFDDDCNFELIHFVDSFDNVAIGFMFSRIGEGMYFPRYPINVNENEFTVLEYVKRTKEEYINPSVFVRSGKTLSKFEELDMIIPPGKFIENVIVYSIPYKETMNYYFCPEPSLEARWIFEKDCKFLDYVDLSIVTIGDGFENDSSCLIEIEEV